MRRSRVSTQALLPIHGKALSRTMSSLTGVARSQVKAAFAALTEVAPDAVPVVGLGLNVPAGAVSSAELVQALCDQAGGSLPTVLMDAADALEKLQGTQAVQNVVANAVGARSTIVTPPLRCLAQVPSRRIVTLNYDNAIQDAIAEVRLHSQTLLIDEADQFMIGPKDAGLVQVMHLHGHFSVPGSIVLSAKSYDKAAADDRLQALVQWIASTHPLVIVGTSYGEREVTLRDNLLWAASSWPTTTARRHLYIGRPDSVEAGARTTAKAGGVQFFDLPPGENNDYEYVSRALSVMSPSGYQRRHALSELLRKKPNYLPVTLAGAGDEPSPDDRGAAWWRAAIRARQQEPPGPDVLLTHSRVLLTGAAGSGKTQTILHTFDRPTDIVMWLPGLKLDGGDSAESRLEFWMERLDVPVSLLNQASCTLVFDGFDELATDRRASFLHFLAEADSVLASHRVVIASRPHSDTPRLEDLGFAKYTIVPDPEWLARYAENRALDAAKVSAFLDNASGLWDLAATACYGAAVVDALVDEADDLPDDALGLLLYAQDKVMDSDQTAVLPRAVRRRLLDALALTFEARGTANASRSEVAAAVGELGIIEPGQIDECVESFLARSLLLAADDTLRFPTSHAQEARAARALLNLEDDGLEALRTMALGEVDGYHGVRPVARRTVQLCLLRAPGLWRTQIARYDERAVLRSVRGDAPPAERVQAIEALWAWYRNTRVWLPTGGGLFADPLLDDQSAIERLGTDLAMPPSFVNALYRAAADGDHKTIRGNALRVLANLDKSTRLRDIAVVALEDEDQTVRRFAADVMRDAPEPDVDALADAYRRERESLPREAMASSLAFLLAGTEPARLLSTLSAESVRDSSVLRTVVRLVPIDAQLDWVESQVKKSDGLPFDGWIEALVSARHDEFEEPQFERLLDHLSEVSRVRKHRILQTMAQTFPAATLRRAHSANPYDRYTYLALLVGVDHNALTEFAGDIGDATLLGEIPQSQPAHTNPKPHAGALRDIVEADDCGRLLTLEPDPEMIGQLDAATRDALDQMVARCVEASSKTPLYQRFTWADTGESQLHGPRLELRWVAATDQPLSDDEWIGFLERTFLFEGEKEWLRRHVTDGLLGKLAVRSVTFTGPCLQRLVRVLPAEKWSTELATATANRLFVPGSDDYARVEMLSILEYLGARDLILELRKHGLDVNAVDETLVRIGDEGAERRCLVRAVADPSYAFADAYMTDPWLSRVRHSANADLVADVASKALGSNVDHHAQDRIWKAYENIFGDSALAAVDDLASLLDPSVSTFLWHQRDRMLGDFLERRCLAAVGPTLAAALHCLGLAVAH